MLMMMMLALLLLLLRPRPLLSWLDLLEEPHRVAGGGLHALCSCCHDMTSVGELQGKQRGGRERERERE